MNRNELMSYLSNFFEDCLRTARAKNSDYCGAGDEANPFANFQNVEMLGICSAEQGFMTRMSDKLSRVASLLSSGQQLVKEESIEDTLKDLANYCALLSAYLHRKQTDVQLIQEITGTDNG